MGIKESIKRDVLNLTIYGFNEQVFCSFLLYQWEIIFDIFLKLLPLFISVISQQYLMSNRCLKKQNIFFCQWNNFHLLFGFERESLLNVLITFIARNLVTLQRRYEVANFLFSFENCLTSYIK